MLAVRVWFAAIWLIGGPQRFCRRAVFADRLAEN
jgi:hypothetical protein